jgi:hypothetical protein
LPELAAVEREAFDRTVLYHLAYGRALRREQRRLGGYGDLFGESADLHGEIDLGPLVDLQRDGWKHCLLEAGDGCRDPVVTDRKIGNGVIPGRTAGGLAGLSRLGLEDSNGGIRNDAALRVAHDAGKGGRGGLSQG